MRIKDTKANKIFMLIALIVLMLLVYSAKFSKRESSEQTINYEKGISIEAITANINIWVDESLKEAKVVYNTKDSNEIEIKVDSKGYTTITEKKKNQFINIAFDNENPTISLYLPSSTMGDLSIKSVSGSIETFDEINFNNLKIYSNSGDIRLMDVISKNKIDIKTISSDISIQKINSPTIVFATTNGNIDTSEINSSSVNIASISGSIDIPSIIADELTLSTTSANIEVDYLDISEDLSISLISGDVDLVVADKEYKYKVNTISGDITINNNKYENQYSTTKGIPFNIKSISGEINIIYK